MGLFFKSFFLGIFILSVHGNDSLSLGLKPFEGIEEVKLPPNQFFMLRNIWSDEQLPNFFNDEILFQISDSYNKNIKVFFSFSPTCGKITLLTMATLDDFFRTLRNELLKELQINTTFTSKADEEALEKGILDIKKTIEIGFKLNKQNDYGTLLFKFTSIEKMINPSAVNIPYSGFNQFMVAIRNFVINRTLDRQKEYLRSLSKKEEINPLKK